MHRRTGSKYHISQIGARHLKNHITNTSRPSIRNGNRLSIPFVRGGRHATSRACHPHGKNERWSLRESQIKGYPSRASCTGIRARFVGTDGCERGVHTLYLCSKRKSKKHQTKVEIARSQVGKADACYLHTSTSFSKSSVREFQIALPNFVNCSVTKLEPS